MLARGMESAQSSLATIARRGAGPKPLLWHPFSNMASVVGSGEFTVDRGDGVWIYDADGRRYLDATSSLWYANVGHGRLEIADAVRAQMARLETYSVFGDLANEPALVLAERLSSLAPIADGRVFLTTGGGEAIDTAAKLARQYWAIRGMPERRCLIGRSGGYHGSNGFGTSIGGIESNRAGFGPFVADTAFVRHDSVDALQDAISEWGRERVAAFFVEPVIGAGGIYPPAPGYMEGVARVCAENGVLLIADAVICGFGRLGTWFGIERWSVTPDMIVFAKGVTSGYLPVGGVIITPHVAEPFWTLPGHSFRHGHTYSGHAACCTAALVNIEILERENLIPRGAELEQTLIRALAPVADHPLVAEVRGGTGLLAAVELGEASSEAGITPVDVVAALRDHGVLARPLLRSIAFSPPLITTPDEISLIGGATKQALDTVIDSRTAARPA